jgi:hypothetical protein
MRVCNGDLIEADFGEGRKIYRVCTLDASNNRLKLAANIEAGALDKRHSAPLDEDPFRYEMKSYNKLRQAGARRVRVDAIGRTKPVDDAS